MAIIATITGQLTLTIGAAAVDIGRVTIPIDAYPGASGELTLKPKVDAREVREYVEAVFGQYVGAEVIEP